jgi:hypothetical protein
VNASPELDEHRVEIDLGNDGRLQGNDLGVEPLIEPARHILASDRH